ncbi:hypothetical protein Tco_0802965 [Tanacetum coccineum]|uniref:Uncharacterized protein n=1 Tax=Tanacetum coccineum TaxID=301880 RepID=A0ABQ5A4C1_9ASTR
MRQERQVVGGEGSNVAHDKYYKFEDISATNSDATRDSSCPDTDEEKEDETDDFDMDISVDDDKRDEDDAAGFRAFKLEALTSINVSEVIEKAVQAKILTEMKKQLPTYVSNAISKTHDDQDHPNDHEGETRKIRRKDDGQPSSRSSKKNNSPVVLKDELTIADLEGAGLEKLKKQYKNNVELEYHVDQLKTSMLTKA